MAPADLTARPFSLAEIIDRSIALVRRHFRALFLAMLLVQGPALLLARALPDPLELLSASGAPDRALPALLQALRALGLVFLALLVLQLVATAATARILGPTLDPRQDAPRPGRLRAAWAVAGAAVLQVLAVALAPVVGMLPGTWLLLRSLSFPTALAGALAAAAGGLTLFVVVSLRLMVAPVAAALEGRAGWAALARSIRLMAPRPGTRLAERPSVRASLVLLAALVLAISVNGLAGLPRAVAARLLDVEGGLAALAAHLPLALEIPLTLFEAAASAAVQPFSLAAVVVFYFDRRARREALDVDLWAARLEAAP